MKHDYYVDGPAVEYHWSRYRTLMMAIQRWGIASEVAKWCKRMLRRST